MMPISHKSSWERIRHDSVFNPLAALPLSLGRHPHAIVPAFYTAAASAKRGNEEEDQPNAAPLCQTDRPRRARRRRRRRYKINVRAKENTAGDGGTEGARETAHPAAAAVRPCPPNPKQRAIAGSPNFLRVARLVRRPIEREKRDRSKW